MHSPIKQRIGPMHRLTATMLVDRYYRGVLTKPEDIFVMLRGHGFQPKIINMFIDRYGIDQPLLDDVDQYATSSFCELPV